LAGEIEHAKTLYKNQDYQGAIILLSKAIDVSMICIIHIYHWINSQLYLCDYKTIWKVPVLQPWLFINGWV